ncbi:hypothetical protein WA1_21715 [Scytonema hofmannii PCC 7110]|uniref:Uncharacterized protein n=1 Tax=Scytonema hofmannii PCC 7110 TaxID=128403 RepID=A0A139X9F3_9CYAN|nr:hypothetical protein [Scytonema hofmannii]KYC41328.1 hypothetical protein WA1_21715 [Scytonema hofmannii PCC 7110]
MYKLSSVVSLIPSILILVTAKVAFTQQSWPNHLSSVIPSSNEPVCYMQRKDGTVLDLTKVCGKTNEQPSLTNEQPSLTNSQEMPEQPIVVFSNDNSPEIAALKKEVCESQGYCPSYLPVDVMTIKEQ